MTVLAVSEHCGFLSPNFLVLSLTSTSQHTGCQTKKNKIETYRVNKSYEYTWCNLIRPNGINVQLDRKNKQKIFWIELNEIVQITHDKLGLVEDKDKR